MNWFTPIYPFFAVLGFGLGWKHEKLQYFSFFFISGSAPVHTYLSNFGRFRIGLGWKHEKLQYFSFCFMSGSAPIHTYLPNFCLFRFFWWGSTHCQERFFRSYCFNGLHRYKPTYSFLGHLGIIGRSKDLFWPCYSFAFLRRSDLVQTYLSIFQVFVGHIGFFFLSVTLFANHFF